MIWPQVFAQIWHNNDWSPCPSRALYPDQMIQVIWRSRSWKVKVFCHPPPLITRPLKATIPQRKSLALNLFRQKWKRLVKINRQSERILFQRKRTKWGKVMEQEGEEGRPRKLAVGPDHLRWNLVTAGRVKWRRWCRGSMWCGPQPLHHLQTVWNLTMVPSICWRKSTGLKCFLSCLMRTWQDVCLSARLFTAGEWTVSFGLSLI